MTKKLTDITKTHKLEDLVKKFYPGPLDKSDQTEKINTHGLQPKPRDEKQFMRFHRVEKHADRNGNGEDVFNASKIEQVKSVHHGRSSEKASERAAFEPTETSIGESRQNWWRGVDDLPKSKVKKWLKGDDIGDVKKSMAKGKFKEKMCKDGDKKACKEFKEETDQLDEGYPTRKHFQAVADTVSKISDPHERLKMANHHAEIFHKMNPRFNHQKFHEAAGTWTNRHSVSGSRTTTHKNARVNEDKLNELSDRTMARYVRHAADSRAEAQHDLGKMKGKIANRDQKALTDLRKSDDYKEVRRTSDKRAAGIELATKKLAKEDVEQLDELKKSTLKSYTKKAAMSLNSIAGEAGYTTHQRRVASDFKTRDAYIPKEKKLNWKAYKRQQGVMRAADRMTGTFQHRGDKSKKYKGDK